MLTYDPAHDFMPTLLWQRVNERRRLGEVAWRNAGGERLSDATPPTPLWGLRPGFLLLDNELQSGWRDRFGGDGVRETSHGDRSMFTLVMDAVTKDVYAQPGHWQAAQWYSCYIWPSRATGRPTEQTSSLNLNLELADPVVRRWDGNSLEQLYSEDVIDWLRDRGAGGVTFSLVWDPDRLSTLPIEHRNPHETVVLSSGMMP